jgi:hypothetical protein
MKSNVRLEVGTAHRCGVGETIHANNQVSHLPRSFHSGRTGGRCPPLNETLITMSERFG